MSTKTTFKRVALVAVAALGLSIVSVAPSGAAIQADSLNHFKVATCSASGTVGATNVATTADSFGDCGNYDTDSTNVLINGTAVFGLGQSFVSSAIGDAATVTARLVTNAYNGTGETVDGVAGYGVPTALPVLVRGSYANHINSSGNITQTISADNLVVTNTSTATGSITGAMKATFTPTMRGTYVITFTPQTGSLGKAKTWTVNAYATQGALDLANGVDNAIAAAKTTSFLNTGETTTATADATVSASMALATSAAATIVVTPKNAAGTTIANATFPITATISGPGTLAIGTNLAAITSLDAGVGRAVTGTTGHYTVGVFADGTAGVATITISTGTTVLSTETVTFYGAAAKITPTVVNSVLAIGGNTGAVTAVVTDAAGVLVPNVRVYAVSGTDATIDADTYVASTAVSTSAGAVSFDLTGLAAGTATITLTLNSSSAGTSTVSALAGTMRVSDGVATKVDYTFAKDTYAPGEAAVVKATVSNAAGVMPAGTYTVLTSAGVTANYTISGLPAATVLAVGSTGTASYTVTIPTGITGDLQLAGTSSATTIAATFGKATIVNAAQDTAQAAVDAAAEAIDAANAATDAANAAAEAADAATAAAQDAADAVAALSVSVAAMIDSLKKQITALTNLVIKIQKKVKA